MRVCDVAVGLALLTSTSAQGQLNLIGLETFSTRIVTQAPNGATRQVIYDVPVAGLARISGGPILGTVFGLGRVNAGDLLSVFMIDPANQTYSNLGQVTSSVSGGMAFNPTDGLIYFASGFGPTYTVTTFDPSDGSEASVGTIDASSANATGSLDGIDFDPFTGELVALYDGTASNIGVFNLTTGLLEPVGMLPSGSFTDFAIDPATGDYMRVRSGGTRIYDRDTLVEVFDYASLQGVTSADFTLVPAPASVSLLGAAGLFTSRRRR